MITYDHGFMNGTLSGLDRIEAEVKILRDSFVAQIQAAGPVAPNIADLLSREIKATASGYTDQIVTILDGLLVAVTSKGLDTAAAREVHQAVEDQNTVTAGSFTAGRH